MEKSWVEEFLESVEVIYDETNIKKAERKPSNDRERTRKPEGEQGKNI